MAQKLHEAKISTAHLCWHEVVKPLRTHSTNQQIGINTLKSQLKQLRSDYLKEISALRDTKRNAATPWTRFRTFATSTSRCIRWNRTSRNS